MASAGEVGPGKIDLVRSYEVHTENTVGEGSLAVTIRSQTGGAFNQGRYVAEKNEYYESLGLRQTRVEMLPEAHLKLPVGWGLLVRS